MSHLTDATPLLDGSRELIAAIVQRALADAQGQCSPTVSMPVAHLGQEARQWLRQEEELRALVELCGLDPPPVLARVRHLLYTTEETPHRSAPVHHWQMDA